MPPGYVGALSSSGVGAGLNKGIAGVIVGGQALTLVATPVMYSLFDDAASLVTLVRNRDRRTEPLQ